MKNFKILANLRIILRFLANFIKNLYQGGDVKLEKILLVTPDEKEIWAFFLPRYIP